jgi:hypothetical protein
MSTTPVNSGLKGGRLRTVAFFLKLGGDWSIQSMCGAPGVLNLLR